MTYPLIARRTPLLDLIKELENRPTLGILAKSPEDVRQLRQRVIAGVATSAIVALTVSVIF
jgi:hypothetical protein